MKKNRLEPFVRRLNPKAKGGMTMNSEFTTFRKNLAALLADAVIAVNEIAEACDEPMLKEKVFALKRTMERARRLCEGGELVEERPPRGEPAPEFGEGARIIEL